MWGRMGKLLVTDFKLEDVELMDLRSQDQHLMEDIKESQMTLRQVMSELLEMGEIRSVFLKSSKGLKLVTVMGYKPMHQGSAEIWQLPNEGMLKQVPKELKRAIHEIEKYIISKGYWRLWTMCQNREIDNRWMKFLGYKLEGILEKGGAEGEDLSLWAKVV